MPLVQITLARGRTPEQLAVTQCEPEHWLVGGGSLATLRASGRR